MRILGLEDKPFHTLAFRNVAPGRVIVTEQLPCVRAYVDNLADGVQAIVAVSDLQGRDLEGQGQDPPRLLGELLVEGLEALAELGKVPPLHAVGVILAGDLFARPELDRRGGSGDVRSVWKAFVHRSRWVAGVAGNHDWFGPGWSLPHFEAFKRQASVFFLDGNIAVLDNLRIAGLSGTIGNPRRPFRRSEEDFCECVGRLADDRPDILVMHDGPDVSGTDLKGWPSIRHVLERSPSTLVIRGHAHWHVPLAALANGTQVLNVDSRVIVLQPTTR